MDTTDSRLNNKKKFKKKKKLDAMTRGNQCTKLKRAKSDDVIKELLGSHRMEGAPRARKSIGIQPAPQP